MAKKIVLSSPTEVRAWARENGHSVGVKGKLPPGVIVAYNEAHPDKPYREGAFVKTITVTGTRVLDGGGKVPARRTATVSAIREAARAAGVEVGQRGRLRPEVLEAFAVGKLDAAPATA